MDIEKLERNIFKKFLHWRVGRVLDILEYCPTQSDERKFLHSNYRNQVEMNQISLNNTFSR